LTNDGSDNKGPNFSFIYKALKLKKKNNFNYVPRPTGRWESSYPPLSATIGCEHQQQQLKLKAKLNGNPRNN
jgi:hypothetical protein